MLLGARRPNSKTLHGCQTPMQRYHVRVSKNSMDGLDPVGRVPIRCKRIVKFCLQCREGADERRSDVFSTLMYHGLRREDDR